MEADQIHKCMSDMVHILTAGDPEVLDDSAIPVAEDIITDCAQFASTGIQTGNI